jgi:predicted transcriptional regulator
MFAKGQLNAPIKTVPVVIKDKSNNPVDLLKSMLHANEYTPFTVYEKAVIAKRLKSFNWTDKQIAEEMGCTSAFVGQMLALAGAPQVIQELVESGQMSATAAMDVVKEHGENAASVATAAVKAAKAKGKGKATMKDVTPAEERNAQKTKNARKVALDLYKVLVAISKDEAVMKRMDAKTVEKMDALIMEVEKKPKVKEPKPEVVKPIKTRPAAKTPAAKKTAAKPKNKTEEEWNKAVRGAGRGTESRAAANGRTAQGRRSW